MLITTTGGNYFQDITTADHHFYRNYFSSSIISICMHSTKVSKPPAYVRLYQVSELGCSTRHARLFSLAPQHLPRRVAGFCCYITRENGAITAIIDHQRYRHYIIMCPLHARQLLNFKPPVCTLVSSRGVRLQHNTRLIMHPCRHLSRRRSFFRLKSRTRPFYCLVGLNDT